MTILLAYKGIKFKDGNLEGWPQQITAERAVNQN